MTIQNIPRCFVCVEAIEGDMVFEASCGHEQCSSAAFHPICLMRWRDIKHMDHPDMLKIIRRWFEVHGIHVPGDPD